MTLGAGALKELMDYYSIGLLRPCPCRAEWADFLADCTGWAVAVVGAYCVEWRRNRIMNDVKAKKDDEEGMLEGGVQVVGGGGVCDDDVV